MEPVTAEDQIVIDAVVVASGDLWVNPVQRSAQRLLPAIETALEVRDPDGWIFNRQSITEGWEQLCRMKRHRRSQANSGIQLTALCAAADPGRSAALRAAAMANERDQPLLSIHGFVERRQPWVSRANTWKG